MINLNSADINRKCKILEIDVNDNILNRFIDIGIIPGNIIEKVLISPFGGISAYYIMDSVIAIRDKDIKGVMVEYV